MWLRDDVAHRVIVLTFFSASFTRVHPRLLQLLRDCIIAMADDTSETLRGTLTYLYKQWSLPGIRVDVPKHLQRDTVRQALDMLKKADEQAVEVVHEDFPQSQRIIRCCLREVHQLVSTIFSKDRLELLLPLTLM